MTSRFTRLPASATVKVAAVLLPLALAVSACGGTSNNGGASGTGSASATGSASSGSASASASAIPTANATANPKLDPVKVAYDGKAAPKITFPSKNFSSGEGYRILKEGSGDTLTGDHTAMTNFVVLSGKDGAVLESSFTGGKQAPLRLGAESLVPSLRGALVGRKVGSQVLVAQPASGFPAEALQQMKLTAKDTLYFFIDVVSAKVPLKQAEGTAVAPKDGLPTVTMGATMSEPAKISIPAGFAQPKTTVVQPLIKGNGPVVKSGQTVSVHYTGVTAAKPDTPFDYSGQRGAPYDFVVGANQVIKAWDKGIVGQSVGSRVLLVVPPADGYGAEGRAPAITGTDTLVFVVDILDAL